MHVSRQMLQEEAHPLVNSSLFDHLIIIQNEHDGGGMGGAPFQFLEQRCEDGGKRRRLGRLEQRHRGLPKARRIPSTASQGRDQRDPEAGRTRVELLQREPGDLRWVPARPGGKQRGFAKACRGREQGQWSGKRAIERREQGLPFHQHGRQARRSEDRKSTRLNSSHMSISYAVFCLKKKKKY